MVSGTVKRLYPSYFKLLTRWLLPLTPVTYRSKLLRICGFAAFKQLELFWVYILLYKRSVAAHMRDKEGVFIRKGSQFGAQMRTKKP
ncbi:hypothetical protein XK97_18505 [Obesumbacterium proteus]|nr:hypothetical protein XK97_18505 [Obesumbacterium proteus]